MKTTITNTAVIAAYFFVMSAIGIVAAVPSTVDKSARQQTRSEIIRTISCPEFLLSDEHPNEVRAHLAVDSNGTVKVLEVNATDEKLKTYVVGELHNLKVKKVTSPETFILVIKFKKA